MKWALTMLLVICTASLPGAHEPYIGREEIRTEYLRIIFEPADEAYAQRLAAFGDREVEILGELLGHLPKGPVPVVLTSRSASANGFYSPFPHTITMFITSPSNRFIGAVTEDWLRTLFIHELTHYIHLTSPVGLPRILAPVFGPDITAMNTAFMPGWWIEGIATYVESTYAPGGRGREARFEQTWKAPLLEGRMWSYAQSAYPGPFPPPGRIYSAGYLFTDYLIDRFGEDILRRVNTQYARVPFLGISYALGRVTGTSGRALYQEMIWELKASYREEYHAPPGRRAAPEGYGNYHLPVPTDRGLIGWASHPRSGSGIYRYGGDGTAEKMFSISAPADEFSLDITGDGTTAVISLLWYDDSHPAQVSYGPVSYADLFLIDLEKGSSSRITRERRLLQPAIHPEGTMIAALEPVGSRYRLVLLDLPSGTQRILYDQEHSSLYEPRFSPDGTSIAAVESAGGLAALVEISLAGKVTELWPRQYEGIFSPRYLDEHTLLYSAQRGDTYRLYQYDLRTGATSCLLQDPVGVLGAVSFSGDLIYSTYRSSGYTLRSLSLESLDPMEAPTPGEVHRTPAADIAETHVTRRYRDLPQMGLWLPLPLQEGGQFAPGALLMMQSILGSRQIQVQGGWHLDQSSPTLTANYLRRTQWGTLILEGAVNRLRHDERIHQVGATMEIPLHTSRDLQGVQRVYLIPSAAYRFADTNSLDITAQAIWQRIGNASRGAFYGSDQAAVSLGARATLPQAVFQPFFSGLYQRELPWRNQALSTTVEAAGVLGGLWTYPEQVLPARGTSDWGRDLPDTKVKIRGTAGYHIPIAMTDIPIPFGGITGFGLSLFSQSALYISDARIDWEETVYAGAAASADISLSSLGTIRPTAGITIDTFTGERAYFFSVSISGMILGIDRNDRYFGVSY